MKPGFYQLIPVKKLCPASSNTSDKLEQDSLLLPTKLLVSVTFVPLLMANWSALLATPSAVHLRSREVILLTILINISIHFCCVMMTVTGTCFVSFTYVKFVLWASSLCFNNLIRQNSSYNTAHSSRTNTQINVISLVADANI